MYIYDKCTQCTCMFHSVSILLMLSDVQSILDNKLNISAASENPQSGTDALAQALLCKDVSFFFFQGVECMLNYFHLVIHTSFTRLLDGELKLFVCSCCLQTMHSILLVMERFVPGCFKIACTCICSYSTCTFTNMFLLCRKFVSFIQHVHVYVYVLPS